jgi:hypothetical protein
VSTRAGLLKGGTSGPGIVVGAADKSLLYQRVRSGQMPLCGSPLSEEAEVERIRQWIEQGAPAENLEPVPVRVPSTEVCSFVGSRRNLTFYLCTGL